MKRPLFQDLTECHDKTLGGGKAVNLGALIRAGFPVPGGFVVTTEGYRTGKGIPLSDPAHPLAAELIARWRALGSVPVAVRSSATAEDMAEASMAGQYDTFLDISTEASLLDSVQKCWGSLDSPRTRSYLAEHGIDINRVAMAVVVQKLVPADVAGVMFTANPQTGSKAEMLVEAAWGLGEAVVSGLVQPDVLRIERAKGRVVSATIAEKLIYIRPGTHEQQPVDHRLRKAACLKSGDVLELWKLGLKTADHFGAEQDMEWAIADGQLYLLQSRPITTLAQAETYETLLQTTRARLRELTDQGRGPWVLHNISETLKHPTPLTWSVIKRFMSGDGGFGAMYKQVGFEPSAKVCADGFLSRIAGRAYMDTSLASEMFFEHYPYRYDIDLLRSSPDAAQSPPTIPAGTTAQRLKIGRKLGAVNRNTQQMAAEFDKQLSGKVIPEFVEYCRIEKERDLSRVSAFELIDVWRQREHRVMDEFAPQSLIPSMLAGMAMGELRRTLAENFWDEDPDALASALSSAHAMDKTLEANAHLYEVATGKRTAEQWLADFGHRAPDELDLSTPRWRQRPQELLAMAQCLADGPDPVEMHHTNTQRTLERLAGLRARLASADAAELDRRLDLAHRYIQYRETGKYYLMLGYDLLRDVALEAGRRLEVGSGVFQLTLEEIFDALRIGYAPIHLIQDRQRIYDAEMRAWLPQVIDKAAIETLGEAPRIEAAGSHKAFAVSAGVATGPAKIVFAPEKAGTLGKGYVLVCPSTDPGWTPLFVNASALVLECGGTLSHGAVVAREMNIPAVVLQGATSIFADGEVITVDGRGGSISRAGNGADKSKPAEHPAKSVTSEDAADPLDRKIPPQLLPPPAGRRERSAARLRNYAAGFWCVFLLVYWQSSDTSLIHRAVFGTMDALFWPLVRNFGKQGAVAAISAGVAFLVMLTQWLVTDNARLREAKRRAAELNRLADKLPRNSPRRHALLDVSEPVQMRVAMASFVPLAVLLGPMVLSFLWFPPRVDPAAWNMAPGSEITVTALVDADYLDPVTLTSSGPVKLSPGSDPDRKILPVKEFLQRTRRDMDKLAPDMRFLMQKEIHDLDAYLEAVPPEAVTWTLSTENVQPGQYEVQVLAGAEKLPAQIVLGDVAPPAGTTFMAEVSKRNPNLKSVEVYYPIKEKHLFFTPLSFLGKFWDFGWLGLYLIVYIPVMFITRAILRVA